MNLPSLSSEALVTWDANPGDILLLSGKGKTRAINLKYQSSVRDTSARYTHVALVLTPFRVIHAIPGRGVEIRAWREIRDEYDISESSVARLQSLDESRRETLNLKAAYYLNQRYSVLALHKPTETFENQAGIVCSQFVAQVFHDLGIICAEGGARDCLPADIDSCTQGGEDWLRISLGDYRFDPPLNSNADLLRQSRDMSFEIDGYLAKTTQEMYMVSNLTMAMETSLESMVKLVDAGLLTPADIMANRDWSGDAQSLSDWQVAWTHHFSTPKSPATFMHEDGEPRDRMKQLFIGACSSIGGAARQSFDRMEEIGHLFDGWIVSASEEVSDAQRCELFQQLVALRSNTISRTAHLDRLLGWKEDSSEDVKFDIPAVYETGIFECEDDLMVAGQCLQDIANWANARNAWRSMRIGIMAMLAEMSLAVAETGS